MLLLTRKTGQVLRIGDDIIITVTRITGLNVRLRIWRPLGWWTRLFHSLGWLTRDIRLEASIKLRADIAIMVVEIQRGYTKLGITAPRAVNVDREEVYQRKKAGIPRSCPDSRSALAHSSRPCLQAKPKSN